MKAILVLLICLLLCIGNVKAQRLSYGLNAGLMFDNPTGAVTLDSVQVTFQGDNDRRPYLGGYVSYELNKVFSLTSGLNYYNDGSSFLVYNNFENCSLCPLIKAGYVTHRTLEVPLLLETSLPLPMGSVFLSSGLMPNIRLTRKGAEYFYYRDAGQGVSDVLPALRSAVKPVVWKYSLGVGAYLWRLRLEARWQYDLAKSSTNPIKVWGKSYGFDSRNNTIRFGVGYKLNWEKKEE
ncbi:hypothetical protein ACSX1A_10925 [Pontibacter sp. MBLB2868]|uniref:hypothetical protein n=1 Tax=Pontibacter sp. MBLB2868 TaxID=3451555 RepID=UPI003F74F3CF